MGLRDRLQESKEKRQMRSFEKMAMAQEEADLAAWQRAGQIANALAESDDPKAVALAQELSRLAQNSVSFANWEDGDTSWTNPSADPVAAGSRVFERIPDPVSSIAYLEELPEMAEPPAAPHANEVATFKHLCDGRDGKLCLYEDAQGHLVAVRAARLV